MHQHDFMVIGDKEEFDPEHWKSSGQNGLPKRDPETHVNVLIVGAGYAGLMTALECWRKGHNVVGILERNRGPNYSGLFIHLTLADLSYCNFRRPYHHPALGCGRNALLARHVSRIRGRQS